MLRYVPPGPPAATGPLLGELRVFTGRDVRLALTLTGLATALVILRTRLEGVPS